MSMSTPRRARGRAIATPTRARDSTTPQSHHHKTADELAQQEAAGIVHEVEEEVDTPAALLSPRARRYASLAHKRELSMDPPASFSQALSPGPAPGIAEEEDAAAAEGESDDGGSGSDGGEQDGPSDSDASSSDSDESSGSDSESESDSDASSDDGSDSDEEELERQLAAAKAAAAKSASSKPKPSKQSDTALGEDEDGELRFESDQPKEAPIPDLAVPKLPARHLSLADDGTAFAGEAEAGPSKPRAAPELDRAKYERTLSKREKKAQPKKASVSEQWTTIPAPRDDDLPQMRKDYQALQLSHTLDPKRFMKGGNKAGKAPERFQIGTMVDAPRSLQDTTLRKEHKYRPGQIVTNIVADADVGTYAKRKFEELQSKRIFNGRGKGWQKRAKW